MRAFAIKTLTSIMILTGLASQLGAQTNVHVAKAQKQDILQLLNFTGETRPILESYATADVTGPVAEVFVEVGDQVKKGQVLCKIDDTRFNLALRQAKASLDRTQQQFKEDEKDYKRNETLFKSKAITQKTLDTALTKFIVSQTSLEQAKISYETAKLDLERSSIIAPIDGYFIDRSIEIGQTLSKGQSMGRVINLDHIFVDARISEADIKNIRVGLTCNIDGKYEGVVEHINLYADGSRAFRVRIKMQNPGLEYKANMFVKGNITLNNYKDSPVFPSLALRNDGYEYYVFLNKNGKAHRQTVTVLAQQNNYTLAKEIKENDEVITVGQDELKQNDEVIVRD